MTKKKILFLLRGESTPSSRHRALGYIPALRAQGLKVEALPIPKHIFRILTLLKQIVSSDLIVIQKKVLHIWELTFFRVLHSAVIYDLDDLATERPREKKDIRRNRSREKRFWYTIRLSRAVIAGNQFLYRYIKRHYADTLITVIPTPINTEQYIVKTNYRSQKIIIGWIGLPGNLIYLNSIKKVLITLKDRGYNFALKIICSHFIDIPGVEVIKTVWSQKTEIPELTACDIGIMPLFDDIWSEAKCGFKALQCMGVGVPVVVSPVGINDEIIDDGENGFLAQGEQEWFQKLAMLIEDEALRKKIGERGRQTVEEKYSFTVCLKQIKELLESI